MNSWRLQTRVSRQINVLAKVWREPGDRDGIHIYYSNHIAMEKSLFEDVFPIDYEGIFRCLVSFLYSGHFLYRGHLCIYIYLLGQWLNFKLFGITYLVGKINKVQAFFFQGPGRLSEGKCIFIPPSTCPLEGQEYRGTIRLRVWSLLHAGDVGFSPNHPGYMLNIGNYTTQLCRDYNKPL